MEHATSEHKQHLAIKPARKYNRLYAELFKAFKAARAKGYRVDFNWLWSKARALQKELTGNEEVSASTSSSTSSGGTQFECGLLSKEEFRNKLMDWHLTTRERLVRTGSGGMTMILNGGVSYRHNASTWIKVRCRLLLIHTGHTTIMRLEKTSIKPKSGFPNQGVASINGNVRCRYASDLMESNLA